MIECRFAQRRGRLGLGLPVHEWLAELQRIVELRIEPVSASIAQAAGGFAEPMHGDPADRIIAATAIALRARLITADKQLRGSSQLETLW